MLSDLDIQVQKKKKSISITGLSDMYNSSENNFLNNLLKLTPPPKPSEGFCNACYLQDSHMDELYEKHGTGEWSASEKVYNKYRYSCAVKFIS